MIEVCAICVISHTILCTRFSYVEEFSILPCPTCPPCQTYVSVGLSYDTLADTVARHVSKIERCIRYDGYAACLGMFKMNIEHVRFWGCVYRTYGLVCLMIALHCCRIRVFLCVCLLHLCLVRRMCKAHRVSTGCSGHYKIQPSTRARPSRGNPASGPIDNIGRWVDIHIQELLPWCFTKAKTSTSS